VNALFTTIVTLAIVESALAACPTPDAPPTPRPLRFVCFNVLHGGLTSELWGDGERLEERLDATTEGLRALDADVIGLQEASRGWRRGNVASRIGEALGFRSVDAGATSRLFGGSLLGFLSAFVLAFDEGPAIVSRYPIARSTSWLLAQCHAFYRRVLLCAEVCTPWGAVEVCSTHLNGTACQAASVDAHLRSLSGDTPIVLMGDLNAPESTEGLRLLREQSKLIDTFRVANPSVPGFTDDQELDVEQPTVGERADYVLVAPGRAQSSRVVASRIVLDRPVHTRDGDLLWSSDHYGVLSDVALFGPVIAPPLTPRRASRASTRAASEQGPTTPSSAARAASACDAGACSQPHAVPRREPRGVTAPGAG
jgi:endonuclease/exonuclease/phosphatase family metal-dependent hydrolase